MKSSLTWLDPSADLSLDGVDLAGQLCQVGSEIGKKWRGREGERERRVENRNEEGGEVSGEPM